MAEELVKPSVDWENQYKTFTEGGMRMHSALSELLDNSCDAKATCVEIEFWAGRQRRFICKDNGKGSEQLGPLLGLGTHCEHKGSKGASVGMHGIGGTHAMLYIAENLKTELDLTSRTESAVVTMSSSLQRVADKFNRGEGIPSRREPNDTGLKGCRIELRGNLRPPPHGADFEKLLQTLAFRYSKAIEDGVSFIITRGSKPGAPVKTVKLSATRPPQLVDVVQAEFDINGKHVRLMAGIVPRGVENERPGLHYRYRYRVIRESSADGCSPYSTARIFGFVDLMDDWKLDVHKDGVTDRDAPDLYEEVLRRLEPMLRIARDQLMIAESAALIAEVEERIREALEKTQKGKRPNRPGHKGPRKTPARDGTEHTNAAIKQPGNAMIGNRPRKSVFVAFDQIPGGAIGRFVGNTVTLNTEISMVVRMRGNPDWVFSTAMHIYGLCNKIGILVKREAVDQILQTIGDTLDAKATPSLDGKQLGEATAAE